MSADQQPVDPTRLQEMADGDQEFIQELVEIYIEDASEQIDAMRAALLAGDAKALESRAHALKGASANVGAEPMRAIAYQLECAGKESRLADAPAILARIDGEMPRVTEALKAMTEG